MSAVSSGTTRRSPEASLFDILRLNNFIRGGSGTGSRELICSCVLSVRVTLLGPVFY